MIVADVNLVAALLLGGADAAVARQVLECDPDWAAPLLWRSEFRSVLAAYLRQRNLSLDDAWRAHELATKLLGRHEFLPAGDTVLRLVASSRCSAYDCEYLALAQQLGVPLVTSDKQVLRSFPKVAVTPGRFVAG